MKCPECRGAGGWYEPVLWRGIGGGPFELCGWCDHGDIAPWDWLLWHWINLREGVGNKPGWVNWAMRFVGQKRGA